MISPYGGSLIDLRVDRDEAGALVRASHDFPSWVLSPRQLNDLELIATGAFSPLAGYLDEGDYDSVCERMRLRNGTLWPIPITLDVSDDFAAKAPPGSKVGLRDPQGALLAILTVSDCYRPDRRREAELVYGTARPEHPGVHRLLHATGPVAIGGALAVVQYPRHFDFRALRHTPAELRTEFARRGLTRIVAFQTRNPLHRAHIELTRRAMDAVDAHLLLHPVVGDTKPGDIEYVTRVRCYQAVLGRYPAGRVTLALLPLAMRLAGPREALLHAIVRRNHGCTHFIVGRDHAGPGVDPQGVPFYGPFEAQQAAVAHAAELGIEILPFGNFVYVENEQRYRAEDDLPPGTKPLVLSGTELRRRLDLGLDIPEWFSPPEVVRVLREERPPRARQGFTVFLTGLPSSGKSTLAGGLAARLAEYGRRVTLLDGDLVRRHLSADLGFSKEDRDENIHRIAFVAAEVTRHGGAAICAAIAPFEQQRRDARALVEPHGGFLLVHTAAPVEVCEDRDIKGLYAQARAGRLPRFTGISDPYETPTAALTVDTATLAPEACVALVVAELERLGYLAPPAPAIS